MDALNKMNKIFRFLIVLSTLMVEKWRLFPFHLFKFLILFPLFEGGRQQQPYPSFPPTQRFICRGNLCLCSCIPESDDHERTEHTIHQGEFVKIHSHTRTDPSMYLFSYLAVTRSPTH